jgi:signal transduction histidine kinase
MLSTDQVRPVDPERATASAAIPLLATMSSKPGPSARAVQRISALGEMTGGIAHDFRNILAVVASGLRVAEDNAEDAAKLAAALAAVRDGVERGQRMIWRLLAFARQQDSEPGPEDVGSLLDQLKMFLKYAAGSGVRLSVGRASNLPKCVVDPPQFNAAIINLVVNARDAMPEGGEIRISAAAIRGVNLGQPRNYVRVRVSDDGSGMPPHVLKRVFDPYFTTTGDSGTGLGVPQVRAMMDQLGGHVKIHSKVGKGTSVDLFFPAHEAMPAEASETWRQLDRWADEGGSIAYAGAASAA